MTAEDTYKTIVEPSEGIYTEKRSKFIAIALPVRTLDEIKAHLETYQKKYYDARHVCYAYMLGAARKDFRANDNGCLLYTSGIYEVAPEDFALCEFVCSSKMELQRIVRVGLDMLRAEMA